jgi:hypothetical protein
MCQMSKSKFLPILASAALLASSVAAQAVPVTFTGSGVGGDGPESASATITPGTGSLMVSLSSLISNPTAAGQLVSDIEINLGVVPTSASLASASGTTINIAPGGAVTPGGAITHWGATVSGGTIFLATAGTGAPGGSPINLIIGPAGTYPAANPSITGRNPQIQGTGTFDLTVPGITSGTSVNSVVFSFGTGPDSTLPGVVVPAPSIGRGLPVLLAICGLLFGVRLLERRRRRHSFGTAIPDAPA